MPSWLVTSPMGVINRTTLHFLAKTLMDWAIVYVIFTCRTPDGHSWHCTVFASPTSEAPASSVQRVACSETTERKTSSISVQEVGSRGTWRHDTVPAQRKTTGTVYPSKWRWMPAVVSVHAKIRSNLTVKSARLWPFDFQKRCWVFIKIHVTRQPDFRPCTD